MYYNLAGIAMHAGRQID